MMQRYFSSAMIAVTLAIMATAAQAITVPEWHPMPVACTPERAQKWDDAKGAEENQAPCHCPPTAMCPTGSTNADNFLNNDNLPPNITMKCCEAPVCPGGTTLAGKPVPPSGDCNAPACENTMLQPTDYNGPYQNFEFGGARGPSLGNVSMTGVCAPPCDGPYIVMVNDFGGVGGLSSAWDAESVLYGKYIHNGQELLIACERVVVTNDCLLGSSKVTLINGKTVAIETLKVGDQLKGPKGDAVVSAVNQLVARTVYYRINDRDFRITSEHPLLTKDGLKAVSPTGKYGEDVGTLKIGDVLLTDKGEVPVTSVVAERAKGAQRSINIRVDGDVPFYVDGVAVKPFKDIQFSY